MTARPLPASGVDVKTSSQVSRRLRPTGCAALEVEVLGWLLLEPEPVVLRGLLQELGGLLELVLAGLLVGGHDVGRRRRWRVAGLVVALGLVELGRRELAGLLMQQRIAVRR